MCLLVSFAGIMPVRSQEKTKMVTVEGTVVDETETPVDVYKRQPAMCSLNFHFRLTTMQITIMINAARIIPVMYQGIFRRCIITRQNMYEVIVSRNGIKRRLRSPKSSGLKPLILRNRKMVSVGTVSYTHLYSG